MSVPPIVPEPFIVLTERSDGTLSLIVLSASLPEVASSLAALSPEQRETASRYFSQPVEYVVGRLDDLDRADGYRFRDEWIFESRPNGVEWVQSGEDPAELWAIAPENMSEGDVRGTGDDSLGDAELLGSVALDAGRTGWIYRCRASFAQAA